LIEEYFDGVHRNSHIALQTHVEHADLLRTINRIFELILPALGIAGENSAIFAAMSHAAFLSAVQLATSGQLPPSFMVARGCVENAIYGFFLFHNPDLKKVWISRENDEESKATVRKEFTISRMKALLKEKERSVGEQFELIYNATIDFGAHPNALAFISHLMPVSDSSGDQLWLYVDTNGLDQRFALRLVAMAGMNALNILAAAFPEHFQTTGAFIELYHAHETFAALPEDLDGT